MTTRLPGNPLRTVLVGAVGCVYQEVGCDSGSGDRVGCFRSRVVGVGPQLGFIISPDHHDTGVSQFQKLLAIRQPEPARRMERLGDLRHIAGGTDAERHAETNDHEVTKCRFAAVFAT